MKNNFKILNRAKNNKLKRKIKYLNHHLQKKKK